MKILLAQPAIPRFQWELDVLLCNVRQFTDMEVVLLFAEHDFTVPLFFRTKYPECQVFTFTDNRDYRNYIPNIRPYLLWQYFMAYPEAQQEQYFYIDSDVIFREWPQLPDPEPGSVIGSDCGSYIDYKYIVQCQRGNEIATKMAEICGITVEQMKTVPGIGAQLVLTNPTANFWARSYNDSNAIYRYLQSIDSNIQKWTAEMWAQLWGWVREGKTLMVSRELDFCRPTDDIAKWDEVKIMHNAGVTGSGELFFKGAYPDTSPLGQDFSHVRRDRVSYKYVEAMAKVK